jgi:hypothetical protein
MAAAVQAVDHGLGPTRPMASGDVATIVRRPGHLGIHKIAACEKGSDP